MYIIYLDTVYDGKNGIVFKGNYRDANQVLNAFKKYNDAKNIVMEQVEQNLHGLTIHDVDAVTEELICIVEDHQDRSFIADVISDGYTGYSDKSVDEIMCEAHQVIDEFNERTADYIRTYMAGREAERVILNGK